MFSSRFDVATYLMLRARMIDAMMVMGGSASGWLEAQPMNVNPHFRIIPSMGIVIWGKEEDGFK